MARQQGILKFKGNIGSFSMYKTQDGFQGREKSGIEPGRVLNDPAFQRTRENLAEFAQVDSISKAKQLRAYLHWNFIFQPMKLLRLEATTLSESPKAWTKPYL